ncbi:MAG: DUF892 family protein [Planctomycetota bacterium]
MVQELKDLHSAETQLVEALPKLEAAATDAGLKQAFASHLKETKTHVSRLESMFEKMDFKPGGHKCAAMEGLIKEGADLISSDVTPRVLDAALVAAAQRVEHYEIAGYGTARAYAEKLGDHEAADTLQHRDCSREERIVPCLQCAHERFVKACCSMDSRSD